MTCAKLRRGARKRREAREAQERRERRVPALSLPSPPPERREAPAPCMHAWGEPVRASFSGADHAVLRVCETCQGFVRRCRRCRRFHLVDRGLGGEHTMPWRVSEQWLQEHGCARRELGEVPIPFVWTPPGDHVPEFDLATYQAIEDEPGWYELEWLS